MNVQYLKIWTLKSAIILLIFSLLTPFLLPLIPSADIGSSGLEEVATGTIDSIVNTNVANVVVTATPDYKLADPDKDWPKPSPVLILVHVAYMAVILFVLVALWFSRRRIARGWAYEMKMSQEQLA